MKSIRTGGEDAAGALHRIDEAIPLPVKLIGMLLLVILSGAATAYLVLERAAEREFRELSLGIGTAHLEMTRGPLESYYRRNGGWQGVSALLDSPVLTGFGYHHVMIADRDGVIIAATDSTHRGYRLDAEELSYGVPLMADGDTVALAVAGTAIGAFTPAQERSFSSLLSSLITAGAVSAVVALGLGLLLLRRVTRPLQVMAGAAQDVAAGNLDRKVHWAANDSLGRLADAFNHMTARLARSEELREQMIADIAHELRNPLAVMITELQAMLDGVYPIDRERLQSLREEATLLERLIHDLRTLSLADAGELTFHPRAVELDAIVRGVAERQRPGLQEKGVSLRLELPDQPVPAWLDPQRLEQVLANLMRNARQHTPKGGNVTINLRAQGETAEITISDTGPGIPPDILPHVFDRFWRGDGAEEDAGGRSGLGLPIARRLVEAQGGSIRIRSRPEVEGTTVLLTLPITLPTTPG